eukprot:TRINITY_DN48320_c0_g1_i1.p1 TRINITY_DN48320_c0_g1~~TRINITY_DN48320_c0_g1_i1.p1  ORF type:complete len:656 (+),score=123.50 TRINITY_DN48320_c0_g1_i1:145-2112(+)
MTLGLARRVRPTDAVQNAIEDAGFGPYQTLTLLLTGGIFLAEGSEVLVMGSITSLLKEHWDLTPEVRGAMVSIVFIGFAIGNLLSGNIGDRFGRRLTILTSYAGIAVFGFSTACAMTPDAMLALRFCLGVFCGIGFPAVYSMMPEVCPVKWRGAICTLMVAFMPIGEFISAFGISRVDPGLNDSQRMCDSGIIYPGKSLQNPTACVWRTLCEMSAIPAAVFFLLSIFCLDESPMFLAASGRFEEAEKCLKRMARMNGKYIDLERLRASFEAQEAALADSGEEAKEGYSLSGALKELWRPELRYVAIFMAFAHLAKDFGVFGLSYVLPQYFIYAKGLKPAYELMSVSALSIPGALFAFICTCNSQIPRPSLMAVAAGMCALFACGMRDSAPDHLAAPCAYVVKTMAFAYSIFTIVYTAEAFPTSIRITAAGCCTAMGRMGSIGAPLIFEMSKAYLGGFDFFIYCLVVIMTLISMSTAAFLPKQSFMDLEVQQAAQALKLDQAAEAIEEFISEKVEKGHVSFCEKESIHFIKAANAFPDYGAGSLHQEAEPASPSSSVGSPRSKDARRFKRATYHEDGIADNGDIEKNPFVAMIQSIPDRVAKRGDWNIRVPMLAETQIAKMQDVRQVVLKRAEPACFDFKTQMNHVQTQMKAAFRF